MLTTKGKEKSCLLDPVKNIIRQPIHLFLIVLLKVDWLIELFLLRHILVDVESRQFNRFFSSVSIR